MAIQPAQQAPPKTADPQAAKVEAHAAGPEPPAHWTPEPALDPRAEAPPKGAYADGMTIVDEQRARSAWIEEHGMAEYHGEVDERPETERPKYEAHVMASGDGAFTGAGKQKQVPGVAPPAKRS
jgi:hypothetical protein